MACESANNRALQSVSGAVAQNGVLALAPTCLPGNAAQTVQAGSSSARAEVSRIEIGSVVGGRYEIVEFVAEGAFGAVYRAHDVDVVGHVVALKLMHRKASSEAEHTRFLREVQLIAAVSHPSVVSFKDHGLHRGRLYIVMPWYEGETLAQRLETHGPLSRPEAARIFKRLAAALAAMHERGIRHQDVKPDNIVLARFGAGQEDYPVLLDLGVGAFNDEQLPAFTANYVAPEMAGAHLAMCAGEKPSPVDGKADVFALALTLVDALVPGGREMSASAGSPEALALRAEHGVELPKLAELSDVAQALTRWLSVRPEQRPTARELTTDLSILTRKEERRRERQRMLMRVGPLLGLILMVLGALAFQLRNERVSSRSKDVRIEQQAAEIGHAREAIDVLSVEQRTHQQEVEAARREKDVLEALLAREQSRKTTLERALEVEQRNARELKRSLDAASERTAAIENELRILDRDVVQLRSERDTMGGELVRGQEARRALAEEREQHRLDQARLEAELASMGATRESMGERIRELERVESQLALELGRLRNQIGERIRYEETPPITTSQGQGKQM